MTVWPLYLLCLYSQITMNIDYFNLNPENFSYNIIIVNPYLSMYDINGKYSQHEARLGK